MVPVGPPSDFNFLTTAAELKASAELSHTRYRCKGLISRDDSDLLLSYVSTRPGVGSIHKAWPAAYLQCGVAPAPK